MEQIPLKHFTLKKQLLYILLFYFSLWQKRYRKPPSGGFQYLFIIHLFIWAIRPVFVYVQYRNVSSVSILANISPSGNAAIISIADANQDAAGPRDMIPPKPSVKIHTRNHYHNRWNCQEILGYPTLLLISDARIPAVSAPTKAAPAGGMAVISTISVEEYLQWHLFLLLLQPAGPGC